MIEFSSDDPQEMTPEERELLYRAGQIVDPSKHTFREMNYYFDHRPSTENIDWDDDQEVRDHLIWQAPEYEEAMCELREEYRSAVFHVARFLLAQEQVSGARRRADNWITSMLSTKNKIASSEDLTVENIQNEK